MKLLFVLRLSSLTAVERHKYYVSWLFASFALTTSSMHSKTIAIAIGVVANISS